MPPLTAPLYTLHLGSRDGVRIGEAEIVPLVSQRFASFSLTSGTGYYEGRPDPGWSIRIATDDTPALVALAEELRSAFDQFGVGVEAFGHYHRCRETNRGDTLLTQLWGSRHGLEPAYFQTVFLSEGTPPAWPENFAIITAYAPTGETWPAEKNRLADHQLLARLLALGLKPLRITGTSPDRSYQEPGWLVTCDLPTALNLGREFLQDAIFWVHNDLLGIVSCGGGNKIVPIGSFCSKLNP